MKKLSREETRDLTAELESDQIAVMNGWLGRGDGIAVYQNEDLGHPQVGHTIFVSFGSSEAQLEVDEPPERLPDIGGQINWRYRLYGVYRGIALF